MALPDGILKYLFDTCIWTLLAWFIDVLLICGDVSDGNRHPVSLLRKSVRWVNVSYRRP